MRIGLSPNIIQELKSALIIKADEHRKREARALGIPVEHVTSDGFVSDSSPDIKTEPQPQDSEETADSRKEESTPGAVTHDVQKEWKPDVVSDDVMRGVGLNFGLMLAKVASQKRQEMDMNRMEEMYGDETSDSDGVVDDSK